MKPVITFDEAGNTGPDLLNRDQPIFALGSVCLTPAISAPLIWPLLSSQSKEVHFKTLKDGGRGQARILDLLHHPAINISTARIYLIDKSFMVTTKIVDVLIETTARLDRGYNIYERGANIALSNILHLVIPNQCGQHLYDSLLASFVQMLRMGDAQKVREFYQVAKLTYDYLDTVHGGDSAAFLFPILASERHINDILERRRKTELDPILPSFVVLLDAWGKQLNAPFHVLFDASKTVGYERELFSAIANQKEAQTEVGYDTRTIIYPLKAQSLTIEDSTAHTRIQVADVLCSAVAHCAKQKRAGTLDDFSQSLIKVIDEKKLIQHSLMPSLDFTPESLGTVGPNKKDPATHVAEMLGHWDRRRG